MAVEKIRASRLVHVRYAVVHHVNVGLVERACPDVIFIGQSCEQVSGASTAVPHIIFVLPVFAKLVGYILLRQFHPLLRSEIRAFSLPDVLRHKQVAPLHNIIPVFLARRTLVSVPELLVCHLSVVELRTLHVKQSCAVHLAVKFVEVLLQQYKQLFLQCDVFLRKYVGKKEVGIDDTFFLRLFPVDDNGRLYLDEPFLVYHGKIVFVDSRLHHFLLPHLEVRADETAQVFFVLFIVEQGYFAAQLVVQQVIQIVELARLVVGRGDIPVEVVLIEHLHHVVKLDEGYLLLVECAEESRRQ